MKYDLDQFIVPTDSRQSAIARLESVDDACRPFGPDMSQVTPPSKFVQHMGLMAIFDAMAERTTMPPGFPTWDPVSTPRDFVRAINEHPYLTLPEYAAHFRSDFFKYEARVPTRKYRKILSGDIQIGTCPSRPALGRFCKRMFQALRSAGYKDADILDTMFSVCQLMCDAGFGYPIAVGHVTYYMIHQLKLSTEKIALFLGYVLATMPHVVWSTDGTAMTLTADQYASVLFRYSRWVRKRFDEEIYLQKFLDMLTDKYVQDQQSFLVHHALDQGKQNLSVGLLAV